MTKMMRTAGVLAMAIALLVGGGLLLRAEPSASRTAVPVDTTSLAGAGPPADLDRTIATLENQIGREGPALAEQQASLALGYLQKARIEADPSFYDRAEAAITSSLQTRPSKNFGAYIARSILTGSRHDFAGQLRWSRRASKLQPFNSQAAGIMGDAFFELGRQERAVAAYQRSIDLRPDLASFARVSHAAAATGDTGAAIAAMRRALGFAGTSAENAAWAHWQLGELHIGANDLSAAENHLAKALSRLPGYGPALESTAHVAAARGDIDRAIGIMEQLVSDYPLPGNFVFLGELHLLKGNDGAAETAFHRADEGFARYMQHGVRPDVDFVTFWADRKIHLARAVREARLLYRERSSGAVADSLALALFARGRVEAAAGYAYEAIDRSPEDAAYRFHAGMIELAGGDEEKARQHLRAALELDPSWSIIESSRAREILNPGS